MRFLFDVRLLRLDHSSTRAVGWACRGTCWYWLDRGSAGCSFIAGKQLRIYQLPHSLWPAADYGMAVHFVAATHFAALRAARWRAPRRSVSHSRFLLFLMATPAHASPPLAQPVTRWPWRRAYRTCARIARNDADATLLYIFLLSCLRRSL